MKSVTLTHNQILRLRTLEYIIEGSILLRAKVEFIVGSNNIEFSVVIFLESHIFVQAFHIIKQIFCFLTWVYC